MYDRFLPAQKLHKKAREACAKVTTSRRSSSLLAFLSAITRNGVVKLVLGNGARNAGLVCLNVYRKIRKRTDIPLQHFTRKYSGYRYLYFPKGWRDCVKIFTSYITMTLSNKVQTADYTGVSDK